MNSLKIKVDPAEYTKFTEDGFFTYHRSDSYWSGIFSDQTIERTLMKAMTVECGPFKRGCTESVVFKWIKGVIYTKDIIEGLERYCNFKFVKATKT